MHRVNFTVSCTVYLLLRCLMCFTFVLAFNVVTCLMLCSIHFTVLFTSVERVEVPLEVHKDNTAVSPHQSSPTLMPPLQFFNEATHRIAEVDSPRMLISTW